MSIVKEQAASGLIEQAYLESLNPPEASTDIDAKIVESSDLLRAVTDNPKVLEAINKESFVIGTVPRLSPFDI